MSEETKAIREVASAVGKAIDASKDFGDFLNRVFGGLIENGVGLIADKLRFYRAEKLILLHEKIKKRLLEKGITSTHPVLPKIGIPLIEQATIEDNDDLHSRWANMLSNAMNVDYNWKIKRSHISILSDMEPIDVLILDTLVKEYVDLSSEEKNRTHFDRTKITHRLSISADQCEISLRNLIRLGCLKPGVINSTGVRFGKNPVSSYKDIELVGITALGIEFYNAVS